MSACAQNAQNQDEDGAGSAPAGPPDHMDVMDHSGASHFLQQVRFKTFKTSKAFHQLAQKFEYETPYPI